jgi:hypothetical protein
MTFEPIADVLLSRELPIAPSKNRRAAQKLSDKFEACCNLPEKQFKICSETLNISPL